MKIPGYNLLRKSTAWFRSRLKGKVLILGYHRIAKLDSDPYGICVRPEYFKQQLDVLHRRANPISLAEAVEGLRAGALPERAVVVTFDDGYSDALYTASSLLLKSGFPATFFVVTGGPGRMFWWDELDLLLEHAFESGTTSVPDDGPLANVPGLGAVGDGDRRNHRERLLGVYRAALRRPEAEREDLLNTIRSHVGDVEGADPHRRSLSESELTQLAGRGGMEIGSHSVSHPRLSDIPLSDQREEVLNSVSYLESLLGREINFFSFPNGAFTPQIDPILNEASLHAACTSRIGTADSSSEPYRLPRLWVGDVDGPTFERRLIHWLPRPARRR